MFILLLVAGGGSFFTDDLTTSIERHQGDSDGQFIIQMEEEVEGELYYYYSGKKETFNVPEAGDYELIAVGGRGGWCNNNSGGYGAQASGTFSLSKGDQLNIFVGGKGGDCSSEFVEFDYDKRATVYTGAGGAGATFIEWDDGTSKTPKLLLVGGGGGGAGKDYGGDDGEDGQDGGFPWGGKNGEGGGLSCQDNDESCGFFLIGGAGGGGYLGDGKSRCGTFPSCPDNKDDFNPIRPIQEREQCKQDKENLLAEGGKSGSEGGNTQVDASKTDGRCSYRYLNGGFGGFGGGGEGGIFVGGQYLKTRSDPGLTSHTEKYEHGGGGGGGGYGGGGAGEFQGLGGGG